MANVLHRTADPVDYRVSVNTPDYNPAIWFVDPDVSQVAAVPTKYWARPLTDPVTEMSQAEKDAVDQAESDARTQSARDRGSEAAELNSGVGTQNRGLIELLNKRDNYLTNRVEELQQTLADIKATTGGADNIRAAIPGDFLPTSTRERSAAIADYKVIIESGQVDAPQDAPTGTRGGRR